MSETKRKSFSGEFKAKVALEAIRGIRTVNVVARSLEYIRRKLVYGRRGCKSKLAMCLMPNVARNLLTHLPVLSGSIPRLGG